MKKLKSLIVKFSTLFFAILLCFSSIAVYAATYSNAGYGVSFAIPDGYQTGDNLFSNLDSVKASYINNSNGNVLAFGWIDAWANMSDADRSKYSRAAVNNSMLTIDDVSSIMSSKFDSMDTDNNIVGTYETINNKTFFKLTEQYNVLDNNGLSVRFTQIDNIIVYNGIMYFFTYGGFYGKLDMSTGEQWLNSVNLDKVPDDATQQKNDKNNNANKFLSWHNDGFRYTIYSGIIIGIGFPALLAKEIRRWRWWKVALLILGGIMAFALFSFLTISGVWLAISLFNDNWIASKIGGTLGICAFLLIMALPYYFIEKNIK